MTVVAETISKPGTSTPWANAKVEVALVGPGFVAGGQILGHEWALTDTAGFVSFDLTPNEGMTPDGCYYVWTNPDGSVLTIYVLASGGPYTPGQLLRSTPSMPVLGGSVASVDGQTGVVDLSGIYVAITDLYDGGVEF